MLKHVFFFSIIIVAVSLCMGCGGCNGVNNEIGNEVDIEVENGKADTSETPDTNEQVSQNGFKFIHHIKNEGPKPQPGEYVYYDVDMYGVLDSIKQYTYLESNQLFIKLMPLEETKGFTNPVLDILYYMSLGDSASVKMSPKLIATIEPGYLDFSYLQLNVKLTEIISPAEHSTRRIAEFNKRKESLLKAQANLEEINANCRKVLTDYKAGTLTNLIETKSGLKYLILEEGKGKKLKKGYSVNLFFNGFLMDGFMFENTFKSGVITTIEVGNGQSLAGWEEAMNYFKYGTKVYLFVPYQLAYGEAGKPPSITPKSDVMFYMELLK